jgi:hypothetical protein
LIASPCVKVCVMDAERRYCTGCMRTLAEIACWGEMTDSERGLVMASLASRPRGAGLFQEGPHAGERLGPAQ